MGEKWRCHYKTCSHRDKWENRLEDDTETVSLLYWQCNVRDYFIPKRQLCFPKPIINIILSYHTLEYNEDYYNDDSGMNFGSICEWHRAWRLLQREIEDDFYDVQRIVHDVLSPPFAKQITF